MLQQELRIADSPAIIFSDNSVAISLSENLSVNKRTKHIDIKHHFIREFVRNGFGKIYKIESKDCVVDIGAKIKKCLYLLNIKLKSMMVFLLYGIKSMAEMEFLSKTLVDVGKTEMY